MFDYEHIIKQDRANVQRRSRTTFRGAGGYDEERLALQLERVRGRAYSIKPNWIARCSRTALRFVLAGVKNLRRQTVSYLSTQPDCCPDRPVSCE